MPDRRLAPVELSDEDRKLIYDFALLAEELLGGNYYPGFGVCPSSGPKENFYNQLWARDAAHAASNYFLARNQKAVLDSLRTIFSHQRTDGALPLRVEKEYMLLKLAPGLRGLAKPLFNLIEAKMRKRKERPVYEGGDFSSAEDTVPAIIIAVGEFFIRSPLGREFAGLNFGKLKKSVEYFELKVDKSDGLASFRFKNADWADSIKRGGKLSGINILWARCLRLMSLMASRLDRKEDAEIYFKKFQIARKSIMEKFYDREGAYFRAEEGTDRIDAAASVFGALYFLNAEECARLEETFGGKLKTASGLKNFYPSYPKKQLMKLLKLIGNQDYHNFYVWPWLTCQNIAVKVKISLDHPDESARIRYQKEAVYDLLDMARLFNGADGAYEIFHPDSRNPPVMKLYKPPKNFMGNLAAFYGAYSKLKKLGLI